MTKTVYQCVAEVAAAMAREGVSKDRQNQQQGYKFRGIDEVFNALSGHLSSVGLVIFPRVISRAQIERQTAKGGVLFYVTVKMRFVLVSSHDGSKHSVVTYGEAMDSADKATNKAMSAAYKYMALQTFCIPTEGDNDADATTYEVAPKGQRPQKADQKPNNKPGTKEAPKPARQPPKPDWATAPAGVTKTVASLASAAGLPTSQIQTDLEAIGILSGDWTEPQLKVLRAGWRITQNTAPEGGWDNARQYIEANWPYADPHK